MKEIAIIGNGEFPKQKCIRNFIASCDNLVFCDGAFSRFTRTKLQNLTFSKPFVVTGDMDSIVPSLVEGLLERGRLIHDTDQETNDLTKAFNLVMQSLVRLDTGNAPLFHDYRPKPHLDMTTPDTASGTRLNFIGTTGYREDHTIANMGLLMEYAGHEAVRNGHVAIRMISDYCIAFPMTDSGSFECGTGRAVSIFSPDPSLQIISDGLEWQTSGVKFTNWWQASLNRSTKETVSLKFSHPSKVLVTLDFLPSCL